MWYAARLRAAVKNGKGYGADRTICRILGAHDKPEVRSIAQAYDEKYGVTLKSMLQEKCSGNYKRLAVAWIDLDDQLEQPEKKIELPPMAEVEPEVSAPVAVAATAATAAPVDNNPAPVTAFHPVHQDGGYGGNFFGVRLSDGAPRNGPKRERGAGGVWGRAWGVGEHGRARASLVPERGRTGGTGGMAREHEASMRRARGALTPPPFCRLVAAPKFTPGKTFYIGGKAFQVKEVTEEQSYMDNPTGMVYVYTPFADEPGAPGFEDESKLGRRVVVGDVVDFTGEFTPPPPMKTAADVTDEPTDDEDDEDEAADPPYPSSPLYTAKIAYWTKKMEMAQAKGR